MKKPPGHKMMCAVPKLTLMILSGKQTGKEYPLTPDNVLVLGRSNTVEVLIEDEMASRRHAKIFFEGEDFVLEDLSSVNGTYVNRQRVQKVALHEGDQIRIGNCNLSLKAPLGISPTAKAWWDKTQETIAINRAAARPAPEGQAPEAQAPEAVYSLSGSLKEVSLVDLLQLLSTAGKSGVLVAHNNQDQGRLYLRQGQIYHAAINDHTAQQPEKTVFRLLRWNNGTFTFTPGEEHLGGKEITESPPSLLMEGVQQADELAALEQELPPLSAKLTLAKPLPGLLRDLLPPELDVCQMVHEYGVLLEILDHYNGSDLEAYQQLHSLLHRKFILTEEAKKT